MKPIARAVLCVVLCAALALSLTGCGMLKTIRDNARLASEREILDTPAEEALPELFNTAVKNAVEAGVKVDETVSLNIGKPNVEPAAENEAAEILRKSANALKNLIVMDGPGSGERELKNAELGDTLLGSVDPAAVQSASGAREEAKSAVTDEDGEPVTDEQGNQVYEYTVVNNFVTVTLALHGTETAVETDENGEEKETVTVLPADAAMVEKVYGTAVEKEEVLRQFEKLAAYLRLNDYDIVYKECTVTALVDMDASVAHTVKYVKNFTVTASVTGVGAFADMGDMTVTFDGKWEADYAFDFNPEE
jgi:hypothetical protein